MGDKGEEGGVKNLKKWVTSYGWPLIQPQYCIVLHIWSILIFTWKPCLCLCEHRMKNLFGLSYSQNWAYFEVFWSEHFIKHTYLKSFISEECYAILYCYIFCIVYRIGKLCTTYRLGCLKIASEKSCPYFHLLLYKSSTSPK